MYGYHKAIAILALLLPSVLMAQQGGTVQGPPPTPAIGCIVTGTTDTIGTASVGCPLRPAQDCQLQPVIYTSTSGSTVNVTLPTATALGNSTCGLIVRNNTKPAALLTLTPNGGWPVILPLQGSSTALNLTSGQQAVITVTPTGGSWTAEPSGQMGPSLPVEQYCNGSTDIGVCANNAMAALPQYALGGGTFAAVGELSFTGFSNIVQSYATTINVTSPFVRLRGLAGWTYTGSGDAVRIQMANIGAWFATTNNGGMQYINIGGTSSAASCIHIGDTRGFDMYDIVCHDFTNGAGFWFDNVTAVTERVNTYKLLSNNNKKSYRFTNTGAASAQSSFGNSNFLGWHAITNTGQTALSIESGLLYHMHLELDVNMSGGDNFLTISGLQYTAGPATILTTSQLKLHVESSGTSTGITCGSTNSIDYEGMIDELSSPGTITDAITGSCFVRPQSSYFTGYGTMGNEGANVWGFRNGTSPQAVLAYNTYSGAGANVERGGFDWITNPNTFRISTLAAGTGVARAIAIAPGASSANEWQFSTGGIFLPSNDNTQDIGLVSSFRPRNLFLGTSITSPTYKTATNCAVNSVSPAACGSAASGAVVVPTGTTAYTINTSAVTAASRILVTPMSFAGNLPSTPTCVVPTTPFIATVSAISAGVSFSLTLPNTTGQTCWQYEVLN